VKTHLGHTSKLLSVRQNTVLRSYDLRWPFTMHARNLLMQ